MTYLLDTNACIRAINRRSPELRVKVLSLPTTDIIVCSIVRAELAHGAAKSQTPDATQAKHTLFLKPYTMLPFDDAAAARYGAIRGALENAGKPIGPLDMQIAAIALVHDLILVTHNVGEFGRIPSLKIEDWEV